MNKDSNSKLETRNSLPSYLPDRKKLKSKETSCHKLVSSFLSEIDNRDSEINSFVYVNREAALRRAVDLDKEITDGKWRPLTGLVLGVKDLIAIEDLILSCGSKMLSDFKSVYTATAIQRLLDAGVIIIGKLNCDEFAMGSSNENSYFGPVKNPANLEYVPGGSSGGSAAAVAAGFCHATIGSDTGGSIRQPAAFCGVTGLKPTYGRVSRMGLVAFASSFDCMGPLTSSCKEAGLLLDVMAGRDEWDSSSADETYRYESLDASQMTIGVPREYFSDGLDLEIRTHIEKLIEKLKSTGVKFVEVSLPHTDYGIAAYYVLATAEASSNLARYDGVRYGHRVSQSELREKVSSGESDDSPLLASYKMSRAQGFGPEVKRRIMLGTYVLSAGYYDAYYGKAQKVRRRIKEDFDAAFCNVDLLLTPATPTPAFKLGSNAEDPIAMYLNDVYTVSANLAGIPGLVLPIGKSVEEALPIGVQLLGPSFSENRLLSFGEKIELLLSREKEV